MTADKILTSAQLPATLAAWRAVGERIVFTNGCFDLLHLGHVDYLEKARALGDRLAHGVPVHAEPFGQHPLGRQLGGGCQRPVRDLAAELVGDESPGRVPARRPALHRHATALYRRR